MVMPLINKNIFDHVDLLKSMANHKRLAILCAIYESERTVGEIQDIISDILEISQSSLSQHLARMREEGIVQARRDARNIYYSLKKGRVHKILGCLNELCEEITNSS